MLDENLKNEYIIKILTTDDDEYEIKGLNIEGKQRLVLFKEKLINLNNFLIKKNEEKLSVRNTLLCVEKINLLLEKIVLDVIAYTNVFLEQNEYSAYYLEEPIFFINNLYDSIEIREHNLKIPISNVKEVLADPVFFEEVLNDEKVLYNSDKALYKYDLMPKLRLLRYDPKTGKNKVVSYKV